jgi:DNA-binding response OmpR family regulator
MKLLIVDDEPHIRQMMRLTLEAAGYDVDEAAKGEDALARFGDGSAHAVVLLDQKMPGIDGLQTLKRLRERVPDACVVMVTAFGSIELAVDAMKLGATDFLRKPMTPETLRGSVAAALAGRVRLSSEEPAAPTSRSTPPIETMTFNGFRIIRSRAPIEPAAREHVFRVTRAPGTTDSTVTVVVDPEAEARVARLTGRQLQPGGSFWREQAESLLAAYLWSEGRTPENGRLTVRDVSRDDIDVAAAWKSD